MALSAITPITIETPQSLSSFLRAGVLYVVWSSQTSDTGSFRLRWKPHTGADFTEVSTSLVSTFRYFDAIYIPATDRLFIVWDDNLSGPGVSNGLIFGATFNPTTGELVSGPTIIGEGALPRLEYRGDTPNSQILVYSAFRKLGSVYGRLSVDGGLTWGSAEPLLTNQVLTTEFLDVVQYDADHISISQIGKDSRPLIESGMLKRTRPLCAIVAHPTVSGDYFVAEPSKLNTTRVADNLRGAIIVNRANTQLYHLGGVAQGTSDSIGAVARINLSGSVFTVVNSAGPVGDGDNLVSYTFTPASGTDVELPGTANDAVSVAVTNNFAYVALRNDTAVTGELVVVNLGTNATNQFLTGIQAGRAIGIGEFGGVFRIFCATRESGTDTLRVYSENALTPTLVATYTLPATVNSIRVVMTSSTTGDIYISMVDRINKYQYTEGAPFRLADTFNFGGANQFFTTKMASNGNMVAAAGSAGLVVFTSSGQVKAQVRIGPLNIPTWNPSAVYALNTLVRPRPTHPFSNSRYYFRASTGGTSGIGEPAWASTGTVIDNGAQWQAVGLVDAVVTDLELDQVNKRIIAVGVLGGDLGTEGRVWLINATGLI